MLRSHEAGVGLMRDRGGSRRRKGWGDIVGFGPLLGNAIS